jgi:hypothetical protein
MARTGRKQNNNSRALSTNTKQDIDRDIPKGKRKHSGEEGEIQKKKRKKDSFQWTGHLQTLKDLLEKNKFFDPTAEECVLIASEMERKYNVEGITGEIVRSKIRTQSLIKFLAALERKNPTKKESDSDIEDSDSETDSEYSSDKDEIEDDLLDEDIILKNSNNNNKDLSQMIHSNSPLTEVPSFWKLSNSKHSAYFINRKLQMRAQHVTGSHSLIINFSISPPTIEDLIKLLQQYAPRSLNWLNLKDISIQNQVKMWQPVTWKIRLETPPPLLPSLYSAESRENISWIEIPMSAPVRFTDFGDNQFDIDHDPVHGNAIYNLREEYITE